MGLTEEEKEEKERHRSEMFRTDNWEAIWATGVDKGELFDCENALPEFTRRLKERSLPLTSTEGRALVPGCGRGYDVEILSRSQLFRHVIGIEISTTATESAQTYLQSITPKLPDNYEVIVADFFTHDFGKADLIYDYAFMCALPPQRRQEWGQRMAFLINPGGLLITIIYPDVDKQGGPPWSVHFADYNDVLQHAFVVKEGPTALGEGAAHFRRRDRTSWCLWQRISS